MINLLVALAAVATQAAPAATPHTLQNLPGTKIHYYDVTGLTQAAIMSSFDSVTKSQKASAGQLFTWTVTAQADQQQDGNVCKIASAKAVLDANVYLPKVKDQAQVPSEELEEWTKFESGLEATAANNLWFVVDRLAPIEQSLIGKPCDQAGAIWDKGVKALMEQQKAYDRKLKRD